MKKIVILLLAVVLLLGLCACGKEEAAPTEPVLNVQPKEEAAPVAPEAPEAVIETQASAEAAPETEAPAADR